MPARKRVGGHAGGSGLATTYYANRGTLLQQCLVGIRIDCLLAWSVFLQSCVFSGSTETEKKHYNN